MAEITLEAIAAALESVRIQVSGLPLVAQTLHELRDDNRQIRQELRMLRAAINDMARINITSGEVEAIHTDLQRIEAEQLDIKTRLAALEGR